MVMMALAIHSTNAQVTPVSQMEKLDRGVVAVPTSSTSNFISWRLLGTDDKAATTFDLMRDGTVIANDLKVTNYQDQQGSAIAKYQVVTKVNGQTTGTPSAEVMPWGKKYLTLKLNRPSDGTNKAGTNYSYTPNDMSVGDVDGDGQYELFVKWDPSNSQDNGHATTGEYTGNVFIDCYQLDGTLLWRIDLGQNIRAGAHYTQFMVYDFDKDGKAELMCKTATGSKDALGNYVNQAATDATIKGHENNKDYRNSSGHVLSGPEYLTVFDGLTGKAIHTTWYLPGRAGAGTKSPSGSNTTEGGSELGKVSTLPEKSFWGDNYGNRSERFLAAVAYVNGAEQPACGIFVRGYYSRAYVWAVSFDGTRLHTEWLHCSPNATQWLVFNQTGTTSVKVDVDGETLVRNGLKTAPKPTNGTTGSGTLFSNGNHNLSIADVDNDGKDEIIWGSAALDDDGTLLYATGFGHGDAIHVGRMIPDQTGYQVFEVHEAEPYGWDLHDAATGKILYSDTGGKDNGRGMAADLTGKDGWEFWSSNDRTPRSAATGKATSIKNCSVNFRIYWDGSIQDQLFDGNAPSGSTSANPYIEKWNGSSFSKIVENFNTAAYNYGQTCNTTKATPCLQADILGDWREELILGNLNNPAEVNIYTTSIQTQYAVPTLMHDHVYRMGVAWQNTAYNQPPHLGYYLPDYINGKLTGIITMSDVSSKMSDVWYTLGGQKLSGKPAQNGIYIHQGQKVVINDKH